MNRLQKNLILLLVTLLSAPVIADPKISQSEILAQQCFVCHGIKGEGAGKIPELRGLEKSDIVESLLGFKTGEEKSTIMEKYAKAYTNEEIQLLADYFSDLK